MNGRVTMATYNAIVKRVALAEVGAKDVAHQHCASHYYQDEEPAIEPDEIP